MQLFKSLPPVGAIVILITLGLFALAIVLLLHVHRRYRGMQAEITQRPSVLDNDFLSFVRADFTAAYRQYGQNTNTPAIINNAVCAKLPRLLFCERFLNNAVSLFVTLGLFGTFMGLSLSVSSLTELLALSNTEEWLSILNSVGGGLVSSLSGMGVAFYTSLVGVACSILFSVLRTILNPQVQREKLETMTELWLDHIIAPRLSTEAAYDDGSRMLQLKDELRLHAQSVQSSLDECVGSMERVLTKTTKDLSDLLAYSQEPLSTFYDTVSHFNENVRDFSQFNYDLRGNIERMDLCFRDLSDTLKQAARQADSAAKPTVRYMDGGRKQ